MICSGFFAIVTAGCVAWLGLLIASLARRSSTRDQHFIWAGAFWSGPLAGSATFLWPMLPSIAAGGSSLPLIAGASRISGEPILNCIAGLCLLFVGMGAAIKLSALGAASARVRSITREAMGYTPASFDFHHKGQPSILLSDTAPMPFLAGLIRPIVIIPARMLDSFSKSQLRMICEHEFAHARHFDHVQIWLEEIALAMLWWSPATRMARRHLTSAREASCDASVLRNAEPSERIAYADTVVQVLAQQMPLVLAYSSGDRREVFLRLRSILNRQPQTDANEKLGVILLGMTICAITASLWAGGFIAASKASLRPFSIQLRRLNSGYNGQYGQMYKVSYRWSTAGDGDIAGSHLGLPADQVSTASIKQFPDGSWRVNVGKSTNK